MNSSKRRTGYGVYDLTRQIARRLQQEWEMVETPPHPARFDANVIPMSPPRPIAFPARIQQVRLAA
ncbi:MAG: hypothetical protein WCQ89_12580 [Verrucomicrobiota bacterium]|jgi:hypothetical protein